MKKLILLTVVTILTCVQLNAQKDLKAYEKLKNTPKKQEVKCHEFLEKYPQSSHVNDVLNILEKKYVPPMTNPFSYNPDYSRLIRMYHKYNYFAKFPNNEIINKHWEDYYSKNNHSKRKLSDFLNINSGFYYEDKVSQRIQELTFIDINSIEKANSFLSENPNSQYTNQVKERIKILNEVSEKAHPDYLSIHITNTLGTINYSMFFYLDGKETVRNFNTDKIKNDSVYAAKFANLLDSDTIKTKKYLKISYLPMVFGGSNSLVDISIIATQIAFFNKFIEGLQYLEIDYPQMKDKRKYEMDNLSETMMMTLATANNINTFDVIAKVNIYNASDKINSFLKKN